MIESSNDCNAFEHFWPQVNWYHMMEKQKLNSLNKTQITLKINVIPLESNQQAAKKKETEYCMTDPGLYIAGDINVS